MALRRRSGTDREPSIRCDAPREIIMSQQVYRHAGGCSRKMTDGNWQQARANVCMHEKITGRGHGTRSAMNVQFRSGLPLVPFVCRREAVGLLLTFTPDHRRTNSHWLSTKIWTLDLCQVVQASPEMAVSSERYVDSQGPNISLYPGVSSCHSNPTSVSPHFVLCVMQNRAPR